MRPCALHLVNVGCKVLLHTTGLRPKRGNECIVVAVRAALALGLAPALQSVKSEAMFLSARVPWCCTSPLTQCPIAGVAVS